MAKQSHLIKPTAFLAGVTMACLIAWSSDQELFTIGDKTLQLARQEYGPLAEVRLMHWQSLIRDNQLAAETIKLKLANDFFNGARFVNDIDAWNKQDYWATPVEFIGRDAGDCEDFAIAKYFTLKALGVDTSKLRITYTKSVTYNQAHMVLAYYATATSEPLILDNINKRIRPASQRGDLKPVYSFNADNLWLNRSRNVQLRAGKSSQLKLWMDLTERMNHEQL